MTEEPFYRQLARKLCTQGTSQLHGTYNVSLYFRVWLGQQEAGREAKRYKEGRTDQEIVGQHRLTMQEELKARPVRSSFWSQGKLVSEPPSPPVHCHSLHRGSRELIWEVFSRPDSKVLERCLHPVNIHIKIRMIRNTFLIIYIYLHYC